jgi:protein TonB
MSSSDGSEPGGQHPPSQEPKASESPAPYDDPMARVLGLDAESSWGPARWLGYGLGGTLAMVLCFGGAYALAAFVRNTNPRSASAPQEIDVQEEAIPPPPPPPPTAKPEDKPEAPRAVPHEATPPPPAQAGKVLTREPDPNEPVDLTGDTIVTGNADGYAGGVTTANGTSKSPVRELAPVDKPAPPGPAGRPAVDRSRPAALSGGLQWDCDFPDEANANQIDDAYVTVAVHVKSDGTVESVTVTSDPGHGFARMARTCAQAKHFDAAWDRDGNPIEATKSFRIHFSR